MRLPSFKQAFPELKDEDASSAEADNSSPSTSFRTMMNFLLPSATVKNNQTILAALEQAFPVTDELTKDEESHLDASSAEEANSSFTSSRKSKKNKSKKNKAKQKRREEQEKKQRQEEEAPSERQSQTQTHKEEEQEYDGPAVWTRLLANHIAPFLPDRSDWNSAMASCKALTLFSQGKRKDNMKLSTSKLPPFPSKLSLPSGVVGHPTSVALSSNRKWLVVGTSSGEVQCCHVLHGWTTMIPNKDKKSHSETTQKMLRDIQAAGSIRHLAFTTTSSASGKGGEPVLVVGQKYKVTLWKLSDTGQKAGRWIPFHDLTSNLPQGQELLTLSTTANGSMILTGHFCQADASSAPAIQFTWHIPLDPQQGAAPAFRRLVPGRACYPLRPSRIARKKSKSEEVLQAMSLSYLRAPGHIPSVAIGLMDDNLNRNSNNEQRQKYLGKFAFSVAPIFAKCSLVSSCLGIGSDDGKVKGALLCAHDKTGRLELLYGDVTSKMGVHGIGMEDEFEFDHAPVDCRVGCLGSEPMALKTTTSCLKQACLAFNHDCTVLAMGYANDDSNDKKKGNHQHNKNGGGGVIHIWNLPKPTTPMYPDLQPTSVEDLFAQVVPLVTPFLSKRVDYNSAILTTRLTRVNAIVGCVKHPDGTAALPPWPERISIPGGVSATAMAFSSNGRLLVVGTSTGEIRLYSVLFGPEPSFPLEQICPDNKELVSDIRAAGPIRRLAMVGSSEDERPDSFLLVVQETLVTLWRQHEGLNMFIPFMAVDGLLVGTKVLALHSHSKSTTASICSGMEATSNSNASSSPSNTNTTTTTTLLFDHLLLRPEMEEQVEDVPPMEIEGVSLSDMGPLAILPVSCAGVGNTAAASAGKTTESSTLDEKVQWYILGSPVVPGEDNPEANARLLGICAATSADGSMVAATLDEAGMIEYRSGSAVHDLVVHPSKDPEEDMPMDEGQMNSSEGEALGIRATVHVLDAPPSPSSCLCFSQDASLLAASFNYDHRDDTSSTAGVIAIWKTSAF